MIKILNSEIKEGRLIKRYRRFLVDVKLNNGEIVTAHCTNTGSLKGCLEKGAPVIISKANNKNRKTKYTWEMIKINNTWVGVNTQTANELAYELLKSGYLCEFRDLNLIRREVKYQDSRFDIYAERSNEKIFIEVKNVTLKEGMFALFPDAPTKRGKKHIETLIKAKKEGFRVVLFFVIQRDDTDMFSPASEIDPHYAEAFKIAYKKGVEIYPLKFRVSPRGFDYQGQVKLEI